MLSAMVGCVNSLCFRISSEDSAGTEVWTELWRLTTDIPTKSDQSSFQTQGVCGSKSQPDGFVDFEKG